MAIGDGKTSFDNALGSATGTITVTDIEVSDDLTVTDDLTVSGTMTPSTSNSSMTDFSVNVDKFTVAAATGNARTAGTLTVDGASTLTGAVTCSSTVATGALTVTGAVTISTTLSVTGNVAFTGGFTMDTNKFTVANGSGDVVTAGTLTVAGATVLTGACDVAGAFTVATNKLAVAAATGIITMENGATLDNDANAGILNITETTVRVTGAFNVTGAATIAGACEVTGAFTVNATKLSIAAATGIITMNEGATIDNDTGTNTLTLTETSIALVGATAVTGALDVSGAFTVATTKLSIAAATGIITMAEGATIDNDTGTNVLTITENTIALAASTGMTLAGHLTQSEVVATAAMGTVRGVFGSVESTGTGATTVISGAITGVRGLVTITGTNTAGGAYFYGTQGKLIVPGTVNHADSRLCAMIAQIDGSSGTFTACQLSGVWIDMLGLTSGGGQFNAVRITGALNVKPASLIYAQCDATFLMDLVTVSGGAMAYVVAAGTGAGSAGAATGVATKVALIRHDGTTYYLPMFVANT